MSGPTVREVAKRWRDYNEEGGKHWHSKTGYLEFEYQVIRSYRTPIACYHMPRVSGKGFVLIYSVHLNSPWGTFAHHVGTAARTVTWEKFYVPNIGTLGGMASPSALKDAHALNIKWMLESIESMASAGIKQFKQRGYDGYGSMPQITSWIMQKLADIENYMAATGAEHELPEPHDIFKRMADEREKLWVKWIDPKAVARRERAHARREAIKALNLGDDE